MKGWEVLPWYGNPHLGLEAARKKLHGVEIWIFGYNNKPHTLPPPAEPGYVFGAWNFVVRTRYTGLCVGCFTMEDAADYIDSLSEKQLIH